jgi:hypothetical protein
MATVRDLVFAALTNDSQLNTLGINVDHTWAAGALDGPQPTPFMVIRWGNTNRGIGPVNSSECTLYVHDDPGDYGRISAILSRARAVMSALAASGVAANWIIDVQWQGDSGDLADDVYKTVMRNGSFNVVANTL